MSMREKRLPRGLIKLTLPIYWASALINGDDSGIEEEDINQIKQLTDDLLSKYERAFAVDVSEDYHFSSYSDASKYGALAGDVAEYTFDVGKTKPVGRRRYYVEPSPSGHRHVFRAAKSELPASNLDKRLGGKGIFKKPAFRFTTELDPEVGELPLIGPFRSRRAAEEMAKPGASYKTAREAERAVGRVRPELPSYKSNDPRGWGGDPKRGAALGRPSRHGEVEGPSGNTYRPTGGKFVLRHIRLDSGGYDENGTYFGHGEPLYWVASEDGEIDFMLRSKSRQEAKAQVREQYPNARFFA